MPDGRHISSKLLLWSRAGADSSAGVGMGGEELGRVCCWKEGQNRPLSIAAEVGFGMREVVLIIIYFLDGLCGNAPRLVDTLFERGYAHHHVLVVCIVPNLCGCWPLHLEEERHPLGESVKVCPSSSNVWQPPDGSMQSALLDARFSRGRYRLRMSRKHEHE
eukprot:3522999-Rhodomonas_salina.4